MNVRIRFSAGLARRVGRTRLDVPLSEEATVADLIAHLNREHPALGERLQGAVPIVAGRHVSKTEPLHDGQEVAFLLPIAGGS